MFADLAQSTSGYEGQILKALAMDVKRMEEANETPRAATPAQTVPLTTPAVDDIPLLRPSPSVTTNDDVTDDRPATGSAAVGGADTIQTEPEVR